MLPQSKPPHPNPDDVLRAASIRFALRRFLGASDLLVRGARLTPRRYLLLLALESAAVRGQRVAAGDLAAELVLAESTMTGLLDRAERAGLVRRSKTHDDGRVVHITATPEGRRRFARAFAALADERRELARVVVPLHEADAMPGRRTPTP